MFICSEIEDIDIWDVFMLIAHQWTQHNIVITHWRSTLVCS